MESKQTSENMPNKSESEMQVNLQSISGLSYINRAIEQMGGGKAQITIDTRSQSWELSKLGALQARLFRMYRTAKDDLCEQQAFILTFLVRKEPSKEIIFQKLIQHDELVLE